MAMPKKNKYHYNLNPSKVGKDRVDELMSYTDSKSDFLPPSITLEDLDNSIFNLFNEGKAVLYNNGNKVPVIFYPNQRWADIEKSWKYIDDDKNIATTFITVKRTATERGTHAVVKYGIPSRKVFNTFVVPKFDGTYSYNEIYKIPQPIPVDLSFAVKVVSKEMRIVNNFDTIMLDVFNDRQAYVMVNGHYLPVIQESVADDSRVDDISEDRVYVRTYTIKLVGYLQDENEFEVTTSFKRMIVDISCEISTETNTNPYLLREDNIER